MKTKKFATILLSIICIALHACLLSACSKEEHKATPASQAGKASAATLDSFSTDNINVTQNGNALTFTNTFNALPVRYAWYVIKEKEIILKQMYTEENSNSFTYDFSEPGNYILSAFVKTSGDAPETKWLYAVDITVDNAGLKWQKR